MDIYARITQDHDAARESIEQLKATTPRAVKTRKELFRNLKLDLWAHHKVEEAVFYAYLRDTTDMNSEAYEGLNEHHVINGLIEELDTFPVDSEEWGVKFGALSEIVDHHLKEEEDEFFKKAKKILSADAAKLMGERFDARKKVVLAAISPLDADLIRSA
ncbi:MAG TPA: hemerythrin domain-containing protein [Parvularculaceae bacterium]|nr:hemerythrin domain-containing protein [Amphiplicatus sp.]MCB9954771.1 hemerythrin domain-containing protein [Caulobacterales bacterium]HOP21204.1 hemerythrin domain-containing protein [Amphiplicatus sp.]HPE31277.1 hemerythrin domain-containing protein [Parvularculaceae bacterium]HRX40320.1 hemerythrin domain-containing protein [Parvularculaceae bacterium]